MKEEINTLLKMKEMIEQKGKEKERITGKLETVEKAFKDFNCKDVDQAIENEQSLVKTIHELEVKIKAGIKSLEEKYADLL